MKNIHLGLVQIFKNNLVLPGNHIITEYNENLNITNIDPQNLELGMI